MILVVVGEERFLESTERERERKRSAQKKQQSLCFHLLKKISPLFSCKNFVCCLERHTHTNQNLSQSPPRTRVPFIVLFEHVTS